MEKESAKNRTIRAIVISSVQPEPTTAGQIKLYRHVVVNPEIQLVVHPTERRLFAKKQFRHRLLARLERTWLKSWIADYEMVRSARWLDKHLPPPPNDQTDSIVITIAHGNGCWAALRYAKKHNIALVTFFDDWWPYIDLIHSPLRRHLEMRFRELYHQSQLALCISKEMLALLGPHHNAQVLYPIPAKANLLSPLRTGQNDFRVLYFGSLGEYGPMVAQALSEFQKDPEVRLEVRGSNPRWTQAFRQKMQADGFWHDHAPRAQLEKWIASADAFLVPMVFEPNMRRRMETSFPSKMLEMVQFGKPLVIWGPEYCSAVQWARQGDRALCVTDPNPIVLRNALKDLAGSSTELQRLAAAARQAAETDFNPDRIQAQFMEALRTTAQPK